MEGEKTRTEIKFKRQKSEKGRLKSETRDQKMEIGKIRRLVIKNDR
jgi:hypothetical protein